MANGQIFRDARGNLRYVEGDIGGVVSDAVRGVGQTVTGIGQQKLFTDTILPYQELLAQRNQESSKRILEAYKKALAAEPKAAPAPAPSDQVPAPSTEPQKVSGLDVSLSPQQKLEVESAFQDWMSKQPFVDPKDKPAGSDSFQGLLSNQKLDPVSSVDLVTNFLFA